jgi:predicted O-methyltransferase YrrM
LSAFDHIRPGTAAEDAALRALMLLRGAQVSGVPERVGSALRRSLRATALGAHPPAERAWIARIGARRDEVTARGATAYGGEDEVGAYLADWSGPWSLPELWGRWLLRLVAELVPSRCLELGTGFGISALYAGAGLSLTGEGTLLTLDREERLFETAREGFEELGLAERIELRAGEIGETLPGAAAAGPYEWVMVDAEHTEEATVAHFEGALPGLAHGAVVIVDDVNLDDGMRSAWRRVRANPAVALALDLRRLGVAVVRSA